MIGRLRRVPLREVWKHEALDFTRWLEENLDVLNDATGLDLVSAQREQSAGAFSVDLIAEESSGRLVVIENQLEKSNHDHLGKVITYVSVLDAKVAIWIVAEPRSEHVTAVSWLNESRGAEFYLFKAEAVAIGESAPAPLLTLIVGPSEESRGVGDTKKELAEQHHERRRFWEQLLERAQDRTKLFSGVSPGTENWLGTGAGVSGLAFNFVLTQHTARVELYIDRGDEAENEAVYRHFVEKRGEIEGRFGAELDWQPLPGRRACRVNFDVIDRGYKDVEQWTETQDRLIDAMGQLENALRPHIASTRDVKPLAAPTTNAEAP